MAFPTAVNDQITDSVTQRHVVSDKLKRAMQFLGTKWVMHKTSTYNPKRREPSGMCKTLHPVVLKAMQEGRL